MYQLNSVSYKVNKQNQQQNIYELVESKECGAKPIIFNLYKQPSLQSELIILGDLLVELDPQMDDFNYLMKVSLLYQDKKYNHRIEYFKNKQLVEVQLENKYRGIDDFNFIYDILIQSQNNDNLIIAQSLHQYQEYFMKADSQYKNLIQKYGYDYLKEQQNEFINEMKEKFINQEQKEDFQSYVALSFINQNELGCPINIQYGLSEGIIAILGCSVEQIIDILQRTIYFSFFLSRDVSKQKISLIYNQSPDVNEIKHEYSGSMITLDGIYIPFYKQKATQYLKRIDGVIITAFYSCDFYFETQTIESIIQIRQTKSHYYNPRNILDLLISDNIQYTLANKFGQYISDPNNFKPPSLQDIYPNKTCKIKQINTYDLTSD